MLRAHGRDAHRPSRLRWTYCAADASSSYAGLFDLEGAIVGITFTEISRQMQ